MSSKLIRVSWLQSTLKSWIRQLFYAVEQFIVNNEQLTQHWESRLNLM